MKFSFAFAIAVVAAIEQHNVHDKWLSPLIENNPDEYISWWNPRIKFIDGCYGNMAFHQRDEIKWNIDTPADRDFLCHDSNLMQVYGRWAFDQDWKLMYIYTWKQFYDIPASGTWGETWEYMAVYPEIYEGAIQSKLTGIWTPVGGYSEVFGAQESGLHPYLVQYRPDAEHAAGMFVGMQQEGGIYRMIDVLKVAGEWTEQAKAAFEASDSPLSLAGDRLAITIQTIYDHPHGIGLPGTR